ncbi:hypothetical protein LR48_Vigan02g011300 [Vigna angularis]|uniref:Pectinesterase inhibitor domain-containing protein n=2 Tax=Phaseolus angularis TaxID=3914 RepID=A0A0L9TTR9_PHAAN|nr:pectinesterase inhibitor 1 [Vigna angularis]KOM33963.1 hypothetical protein LR48_Vigan02g011300 [Vigna angularis]
MVSNMSPLVYVFVIFLVASTSYAIPVSEVKTICSQTQKPSFCLRLLMSNPNPNASLIDLTQYAINVARAKVTNTIKLIHDLIAHGNSNAKSHYRICLVHFGSEGALRDIDYTKEMLQKGDYEGVNVAASAVSTDIEDCISGDSPSDPPFNDPSDLPKYAAVIESVLDVILVLSKFLRH